MNQTPILNTTITPLNPKLLGVRNRSFTPFHTNQTPILNTKRTITSLDPKLPRVGYKIYDLFTPFHTNQTPILNTISKLIE